MLNVNNFFLTCMRNNLHTGEAPAIHTLMNELESEMASQDSEVSFGKFFVYIVLEFVQLFTFQASPDGTENKLITTPDIDSSAPCPVVQVFTL